MSKDTESLFASERLTHAEAQIERMRDEAGSLVYERDELRAALERIRDWRNFRHTGEVRDFADRVLRRKS